ncbi:MAG: hypothetical protein DSY66_03100 [Persephonella sp.]|nr:MAG: hypothetical protein DSY66_03100 [Persephonella sp.]
MNLISWTPTIFSRKGFLRDDSGRAYLPKNVFTDAITSAVIFYYIKKNKDIENRVKRYLLRDELDIKKVAKDVKNIVLEKYPVLENLELPEKVYLEDKDIKIEYVEVFDLKEWIDTKGFKTEIFTGTVEIPISSPYIEKLKSATHSYAEALARIEYSFLKEHPLGELFYKPLINDLKKWELPLRIGLWTEVSFKGDLLFFWKIKEVREKLLKTLKIDIKPRYVLYIPRLKQTTGWIELKN